MAAAPMGMMTQFVNKWIAEGHDPADLIESVDGLFCLFIYFLVRPPHLV